MSSGLQFGVYTEMNCMPGVSTSEAVWDVMRHIERSDRHGFEVYMAIEHHFFPTFGQSANPLALFAAAAQRTDGIRFRTLCHTLPLHEPTVLAGEIATADVLTGGRLDIGFGRGHAWLMHRAGIAYEETGPRHDEAAEIICLGLSEERFSYRGAVYQLEDVSIYPRPVQQPMPPVYVTGTSGRSFRAAAQKGWRISVGGPGPYAMFAGGMQAYRDACTEFGSTPFVSYIQPLHIAQTEQQALEEARLGAPYFYQQIAKPIVSLPQERDRERLVAAGYGFYASDAMNQMMQLDFDAIMDQSMVWVGTPAQIRNRLTDFLDREKLQEFAIQLLPRGPETISREAQDRTLDLFATQVMPEFR